MRKYNRTTGSIDGVTAIAYKFTTPFLNYGTVIGEKTIITGSISLVRKDDSDLIFSWGRDENARQTASISQTGFDTLGNFTLGTSTLGGSTIVDRFVDLTTGGQFRSIQYQVTSSTLNPVDIHAIGAGIDVDEGWSTE